jgi:hypothetical protein
MRDIHTQYNSERLKDIESAEESLFAARTMEWAKEYRELMQREGKLVLPGESFSGAKTIITIGGSDRLGLVDTGASKSHVSSNVYEELKAQGRIVEMEKACKLKLTTAT